MSLMFVLILMECIARIINSSHLVEPCMTQLLYLLMYVDTHLQSDNTLWIRIVLLNK